MGFGIGGIRLVTRVFGVLGASGSLVYFGVEGCATSESVGGLRFAGFFGVDVVSLTSKGQGCAAFAVDHFLALLCRIRGPSANSIS